MNLWTDGIIGNEDDRTPAALDNPNVNYIAAAAASRRRPVPQNHPP